MKNPITKNRNVCFLIQLVTQLSYFQLFFKHRYVHHNRWKCLKKITSQLLRPQIQFIFQQACNCLFWQCKKQIFSRNLQRCQHNTVVIINTTKVKFDTLETRKLTQTINVPHGIYKNTNTEIIYPSLIYVINVTSCIKTTFY